MVDIVSSKMFTEIKHIECGRADNVALSPTPVRKKKN